MIKKFNHVGIAVRDLETTVKFFEKTYGAKLLWRRKFEDQKIESAFVSIGEVQFELSASLERQSVIAKFIENRGEGIHHVSLEVDQFDQVIKDLKANGLRVISEADTDDFKAAFIHPQDNFGVLTEIIQPKHEGMLGQRFTKN
jgi:methylmalonyl-CoA/ethylmalonyl-CoA epimerase